MKFTMAQLTLGAVLAVPTWALDAPKQFVRKEGHVSAERAAETNAFQAQVTKLLASMDNRRLESVNGRQLQDDAAATTECPVCDAVAADSESDSRPLQSVRAKVKGLTTVLVQGISSTNVTLATALESTDDVLRVFASAATQFTTLATTAQQLKASYATALATATVPSSIAPLIVATFDLLEDITVTSADYFNQVTELIVRAEIASIGMVVSMILSTMTMLERVSLGVIDVLVRTLTTLSGAVSTDETPAAAPSTLPSLLLASGGIFAEVVAFLAANNDESGLATLLDNAGSDMAGIATRLATFVDLADSLLQSVALGSSNTNSTDLAVQGDTINEILALITNLISSILNIIVSIISTIVGLITGIISAVLNLILGIISAILSLITGILNSILGIFSVQADAIGTASVGTLVALRLINVIVSNPEVPVNVATCAMDMSACPYPVVQDLNCRKDALMCQNKALADILPSL